MSTVPGIDNGRSTLLGTSSTTVSGGGLIGPQTDSMVEKSGGELFGSNNHNTFFGQSQPFEKKFVFGTPTAQPTSNIFATLITRFNGIRIIGTSATGFNGFASYRTLTSKPVYQKQLFTQSIAKHKEGLVFGSSDPNASFGKLQPIGTGLSTGTPIVQPAISSTGNNGRDIFGQVPMVGKTGGELFVSRHINTSFGQSQPVGIQFSFVKPTAQPTSNIFGTLQTSIAGTEIINASDTGNNTDGDIFGQKNASMVGKTGGELFVSRHLNTLFGQSQPVGIQFSFAKPTVQPTSNIFGTPQTSNAGTGIISANKTGNNSGRDIFGQKNASLMGKTGDELFGINHPNTSFGQSQPVAIQFSFAKPTAQPTSNIFGTPQTSNAGTGIISANKTGFNGFASYITPTSKPESQTVLFTQSTASMAEENGVMLFGSSNPNASFGKLQPVGRGVSTGTPTVQPDSSATASGELFVQQNTCELFGSKNPNNSIGQSQSVGKEFFFVKPTAQPTSNIFGSPKTSIAGTGVNGASNTGINTGLTTLFETPTPTAASGGVFFGQKNASMLGKTECELFGSSNLNTSFGQSQPVGTRNPFGTPTAQPTSYIFSTPKKSIFGTGKIGTSTIGSFAATSGSRVIKFNPVTDIESMVKNGIVLDQTINIRYQSITIMKEYESKIFEELKFEDYYVNFDIGKQSSVFPGTLFNSTSTENTSLFGANNNKPHFSVSSTTSVLEGFNTGGILLFENSTKSPASDGVLFDQKYGSTMGNTEYGLFGSNNSNTSIGQSKPVRTGFGFGTPTFQPTSNIQTSTACTKILSTSTTAKSTMAETHQQSDLDLQQTLLRVVELMEQSSQLADPNNQSTTAAQIRRMPLEQLLQDPMRAAIYRRCWITIRRWFARPSVHCRSSVLRRGNKRLRGRRSGHWKPTTHSPEIAIEVVGITGGHVPPIDIQDQQPLPYDDNDIRPPSPLAKTVSSKVTVQKKVCKASVKDEGSGTYS